MANLGLLVVCLALGVLLRHSGRLAEGTPQALNGFVLNVALPAATRAAGAAPIGPPPVP